MRSGSSARTSCQGRLGAGRLVNLVALVLQGEAQGGTDAVVVLEDQQTSRHDLIVPAAAVAATIVTQPQRAVRPVANRGD